MVYIRFLFIYIFFFKFRIYVYINMFLKELMIYDPSKRISAKSAMEHKYFDDVKLVRPIKLPIGVI